jgi:hypothetical protein
LVGGPVHAAGRSRFKEVFMSVESLFSSPFIDFLHRQAELLRKHQGRTARSRAEGRRYSALADGLVFRVVARPDRPRRDLQLIGEHFRAAFARAWDTIPEQERRTLLRFWHDRPDTGRPVGAGPRPEIRVLDRASCGPPPPACDRLGHRLTFAVAPADEPAGRLPLLVAHALARVWMYATKRHWGLYLETVETPMERWEVRQGKKADDAARERKLGRLEETHRKVYEAELEQRLRAWGLDGPVPEDVRVDNQRGRNEV